MGRFEELGEALDLLFGKILNRNFNKADELIKKTEQELSAHKSSTQAHDATAIKYDGKVVGAGNTKQAIDNVQEQVNTLVLNGDSSVAAKQAAIDANGHDYQNLKLRLDTEYEQVTSQLAETEQQIVQLDESKATKQDLQEMNNQVANKADKTEVEAINVNKVDKGGVGQVTWAMAAQDFREQITGGNTAVVGPGSVATVNMVDGAGTYVKRTRLGEVATIAYGSTANIFNIDQTNKVISTNGTVFVSVGKTRYSLTGGTTINYQPLMDGSENGFGSTGIVIYFDTSSSSFKRYDQTKLDNVSEYEVRVGYLSFDTNQKLLAAQFNGMYTIDGIDSVLYFARLKNSPSIDPRKDNVRVYIGGSKIKPDFDTNNKVLSFGGTVFIVHGNNRYSIPAGTTLDVSGFTTASGIVIYYNTTNQQLKAYNATNLTSVTSSEILIAVIVSDINMNFNYLLIDCDYTVNGVDHSNKAEVKYKFAPVDLIGDYRPITYLAGNGSDAGGFNEASETSADIYAKFDQLVSDYPNYISRTLLGYDATGVLPIYQYKLKPNAPSESGETPIPKVLWFSSIHGNGPDGDHHTQTYAMYYFFKDLCENWQENKVLEYFRWYVEWVIIPIQNPWGVDNRSRYNSNGVDLNRDFNTQSPQAETLAIQTVMQENKDAVFHIDAHSVGGTGAISDNILMWTAANDTDTHLYTVAKTHLVNVSNMWKTEEYGLSNIDVFGRLTVTLDGNTRGLSKTYAEYVCGIPSCTVEGFARTSAQSMNNEVIVKMNCEHFGNFILTALKHFKCSS